MKYFVSFCLLAAVAVASTMSLPAHDRLGKTEGKGEHLKTEVSKSPEKAQLEPKPVSLLDDKVESIIKLGGQSESAPSTVRQRRDEISDYEGWEKRR